MKELTWFEKATGYIIVGGIIFFAVFFIIHFQNRNENTRGKYAELIKEDVPYKVVDVFDGDTVVVNVSGKKLTVRLMGIDTPEVADPRKPVQCFGPEASSKAKEILLNKEMYLEKEVEKGNYDMYGRVLAYAHSPHLGSYNEYMIKEGYAREYTFNKEEYKYQKEFKAAELVAQAEKKGLWNVCN